MNDQKRYRSDRNGTLRRTLAARRIVIMAIAFVVLLGMGALAQESDRDHDVRIQRLEQTLQQVLAELAAVKAERVALQQQVQRAQQEVATAQRVEAQQQAILEEVDALREELDQAALVPAPSVRKGGGRQFGSTVLPSGLRLGAYGEHHFNFVEGHGGDVSDIHRFVGYVGYEFVDWLHFNSETEIEHAFIKDGDGEISIEQFYLDVQLVRPLNLRLGRALHPAGIINRWHEPTAFYGVDRPTYSKNILPSTWSIDGIGAWGQITDWLSYEAYLHGGLDGSRFRNRDGLRAGRIKERPGLSDPGVSSRLDFSPFVALGMDSPVDWRIGGSVSAIGAENGDQGSNGGKPDGGVRIYALDTDLRWGRWEWRAEAAWIDNNSAGALSAAALADGDPSTVPSVADEMFGAYGQMAYHWFPEGWMQGKLENADSVIFVRYDYSDPQFGDVPGGTRDRSRSLKETTIGLAFYPIPNLVFKADYTLADTVAGNTDNRFDIGFGYDF